MLLQTERLLLREFQMQDLQAVHAYSSDALVTRYTSFGPNTLLDTSEFLKRAIADSTIDPRVHVSVAIVERTSNQLIGSCGYLQSDVQGPQYMFGYVLHKNFWGKRYGTEVAHALRDFAFANLNAHRLWAQVFKDNVNSARILQGLKFRDEGCAQQALYIRGKWHDIVTFALLREEWQALAPQALR